MNNILTHQLSGHYNLDFTVENYGIKLILDQIDKAHSVMCFSNKKNTFCILHNNTYLNTNNLYKYLYFQ